jgi:hypothetical protein
MMPLAPRNSQKPLYGMDPKEGTLRFDAEALKAGRTTREVLDFADVPPGLL